MSEADTKHIIVLSGGGWRGAFQYWVLESLVEKYPEASIHGVSVGSINGVMAASGKMAELKGFWDDVSQLSNYLRFRYFYALCWVLGIVWTYNTFASRLGLPLWVGGLYSMGPMRMKLFANVALDALKVPFSAGVVSLNSGKYHTLYSHLMHSDQELVDAVVTSSCMVPLMQPTYSVLGGRKSLGFDGGGKNIFPVPTLEIMKLRAQGHNVVVHAVGCTPVTWETRRRNKDLAGMFQQALAGFEALEHEVYLTDLTQLRQTVGPEGSVEVYTPEVKPGGVLDGSPEEIKRRLQESRAMVTRGPSILPGL